MVETSDSKLDLRPQISVTIWETIAIGAGALLIVVIGVAGLMYKFFSNAADPHRATVIAQSLMEYKIPGRVQGVFGANLGGAKIAIVSSTTFPQNPATLPPGQLAQATGVELFIARVPLDVETVAPTQPGVIATPPADPFTSPDFSFSFRAGEDFQVETSRTADLRFCNTTVPVQIQTGALRLAPGLNPVYAVKYDATAIFDNSKRQITLTAIGNDAAKNAASVFNSLRCK